jgi:hypothetical protein
MQAVATNANDDFVPPAWSCGVNSRQELNSTARYLVENDQNDDHHSNHNFDPSNNNALAHVQHSLRGSEMRIGKRRRVQGTSRYSYWVDIYVEIDYELCNDNGESALCRAGTIGPNTINYGKSLYGV